MLAADSRIGFCAFFFNRCYYCHYFVPAFAIQLNILEFNYFQGEEGQFFHYYQMCTKCRLQTAHRRCWTVVPRPINISALMMTIKRNFSRVASVISRPATCLVSITGNHFFVCVNGSRAKLKTFV